MSTALFITVGGSPAPILTAIRSLQPDRVIFICSGGSQGSVSQIIGEGKPCEVRRGTEVVDRQPNIPTQLGLGDRFNPDTDVVLLDNPDDPAECYLGIVAKIKATQQEAPGVDLWADYTGGTKTMSLALGMAAFNEGLTLFVTTSSRRDNLVRVEWGEATERVSTSVLAVQRCLGQTVPLLVRQYNYGAAIAELTTVLQGTELPTAQRQQIRRLRDQCVALEAWDRFDHQMAWRQLEPYMRQYQDLGLFLRRVIGSRGGIDTRFESQHGTPGHGYEIVEDLCLNAARRAHQSRYDDAVGRFYRALELLAQIRLQQGYGIQTGDVDLAKVPEPVRAQYAQRSAPIQLALRQSYELLAQMPDDPLGQCYSQYRPHLLDALQVRNNSLFAHGFEPIHAQAYEPFRATVESFITEGILAVAPKAQKLKPVQFPQIL